MLGYWRQREVPSRIDRPTRRPKNKQCHTIAPVSEREGDDKLCQDDIIDRRSNQVTGFKDKQLPFNRAHRYTLATYPICQSRQQTVF